MRSNSQTLLDDHQGGEKPKHIEGRPSQKTTNGQPENTASGGPGQMGQNQSCPGQKRQKQPGQTAGTRTADAARTGPQTLQEIDDVCGSLNGNESLNHRARDNGSPHKMCSPYKQKV